MDACYVYNDSSVGKKRESVVPGLPCYESNSGILSKEKMRNLLQNWPILQLPLRLLFL